MKRLVTILCVMEVLMAGAQDPAVTLRASVKDSSILIGQQTIYSLTVKLPAQLKNASITWPEFTDSIITPVEVIKTNESENLFTRTWVITSFDSGYHAIPPSIVYIDSNAYESNAVLLEVHTVAVDTTQAFRDIKDILKEKGKVQAGDKKTHISFWWYVGGTGLLILAAVLFLLRKKKKPEPEVITTPLTLYEECIQKLKEIDEKQYWQNNQVKLYYTEVTDVMRNYITRQFGIPAFELTSYQLLHQLKISGLPETVFSPLKQLFSLADMAKFARVKPIGEENMGAMQIAVQFIENTKPVEPASEDI